MDTRFLMVAFGIALAGLLAWMWRNVGARNNVANIRKDIPLPHKALNDGIILVHGADYSVVFRVMMDFCGLYNDVEPMIIPRLVRISASAVGISFPQSISFEHFCYCINYLQYPEGATLQAKIQGWATTTPGDDWVPDVAVGQLVRMAVPPNDTEYDQLLMTTPENQSFLISFQSHIKPIDLAEGGEYNYPNPSLAILDSLPGETLRV